MAKELLDSNSMFSRRSETILSVSLLGILAVLVIPLPPALLDTLLTLNIGLSILLLLVTLRANHPLELSVFPSLLLLLTLLRLSLNVATTRLILLDGAAGKIISTFGGFVVGGNLIVGLVIFMILVIIQFVVITKGASRISEVAARFTLDALPGKQMAIDAELSSHVITEQEARDKREHLMREAEFHGAMDGASKFVRGDAIAAMIITAINICGGVGIGMSEGLSLSEALWKYSTLTVGDGLVSQIPALLVATTAGILVTKSSSATSLGEEIGRQVLAQRRPAVAGAAILFALGLTPGLPKIPFTVLALLLWGYSRTLEKDPDSSDSGAPEEDGQGQGEPEDQVDDFIEVDQACLEIGAKLIPMVDQGNSKGIIGRIGSIRSDLAKQEGLWVPPIRVRDNISLQGEQYRILVGGREVATGFTKPDRLLAIGSDNADISIQGEDTVEPAFKLPAKWIACNDKRRAELAGYTVVDGLSIISTHLTEVIKKHAAELLSREDVSRLLEKLKESSPDLVDEIKPKGLSKAVVHRILVHLLEERVPITNLAKIIETAAHWVQHGVKDPEELAERAREALGRSITDRFRTPEGLLRVIVMEPGLEVALRGKLHQKELAIDPASLERLIDICGQQWQQSLLANEEVALLSHKDLRRAIKRAVERALPDLTVVSYPEIPKDQQIEPKQLIRAAQVFPNKPAARPGPDSGNPPAALAG